MWTDSEDLAVLSDMYQVKVKIISTKGEEDKNPTVNWIIPDAEMNEYSELRNVELDVMVLLHEKESHFDLIVSEDSELGTLGSLSYRTNIGPLINENYIEEKNDIPTKQKVTNSETELTETKNEMLRVKERNKYIESEFIKCKEELKNKTKDCEKLKIEVMDLKKVIQLNNTIQLNDVHMKTIYRENKRKFATQKEIELRTHSNKNHQTYESITCQICDLICETEEGLSVHIKMEHVKSNIEPEKEFNCNECCFQTTEQRHLEKHFELVHTQKNNFKCVRCEIRGITSTELSEHIEAKHISQELKCNICPYEGTSITDIRTHTVKEHPMKDVFRCRICGEVFKLYRNLMEHIKNEHIKTVAYCRNNLKGSCLFSKEQACRTGLMR